MESTLAHLRSESFCSSFIDKMKKSGRNVIVFYGSETGTAEGFAMRLTQDCNHYGMKGIAVDPEDCDMDELLKLKDISNSLVIFVMATHGEGEPSDNAYQLYEWFQKDQDLEGVKYAVFGRGNKTYEHFNTMGKYVDKKMEAMKANRISELGLGDDDANIEEDFVNWRARLWSQVCEKIGVRATSEGTGARQYKLVQHGGTIPKDQVFHGEPAYPLSFMIQKPPFDAKNPFMAPITVNRELLMGGDRSCMHIELDISGSNITYEPGDNVAIYPANDAELVESIGKRLGADLDALISLVNIDAEATKKHCFPSPCSYRTALTHYLDITSRPKMHLLKYLAVYCSHPGEKEKLECMGSGSEAGKKMYSEWIYNDQRHILAVLEDIPSLHPPIDYLCELLPRLQPRYYSISSSQKKFPTSVHITVILIDYHTRIGRRMRGVTSTYLHNTRPTGASCPTVPIYIKKARFRLPFQPTTPVIMIGPGTGVAPFRGFIQDRDTERLKGKKIGETILYFGCRHKESDFIYRQELEKYLADGTLSALHTAFSRDGPTKVYVQNLMAQNKEEIWRLVEAGGHLYVCGDARNMARDVHLCLVDVLITCGEKSIAEAEDYVAKLQREGKYFQLQQKGRYAQLQQKQRNAPDA